MDLGTSEKPASRDLASEGYAAIVSFVTAGGGYVGICAGALLAGWGVEGASGILGATTEFTGWTEVTTATVSLTEAGRQILGCGFWRSVSAVGGCRSATGTESSDGDREQPAPETTATAEETATVDLVLTGGSWHVPSDSEPYHEEGLASSTIARFEPLCKLRRIARGGSEVPPESWGAAAPAVAGYYGSGRVVVFGPHPESKRSDKAAHRWLGEAIYWASRKGIQEHAAVP